MWQQGKDHVAKEMRQLKRLKMQQVLKEMELEAEYKAQHEQFRYDMFSCFVLFDLILYVPSTIFQICRDRSSWVEPVQS